MQSAGPYDREFFYDLVVALENLRRPIFPQSEWFRALRLADGKHAARFVRNLNGRDDTSYFEGQHVGYLGISEPPLTPETAALDTSPAPRSHLDARCNPTKKSEFTRATKWEKVRRTDYYQPRESAR